MSASPDPDEVLCSTDEKDNFLRLSRLLISGGTSLLKETFDDIHPPSTLSAVQSNPATKKQLKSAKLTVPQWDCLYPSPGIYGRSGSFDVTLIFRLLITICGLVPPPTGWHALPTSTDHSLTADLARIKYYRNSVYGHMNQKMEIPDDQFLTHWLEISNALVRIAARISHDIKTAWQKAIDDFRKDEALTADDERNIQELERWYKNDMDVKKSVEELKTTTQEGIDRLEARIINFQVEFKENITQFLDIAVREKAQDKDIKKSLEEIHHNLECPFILIRDLQLNGYEDTEGLGTQGRAIRTQELQAVHLGRTVALISSKQPQALNTTGIAGENVGNRSIPSAQDVLNTVALKYVQSVDLSTPEDFDACLGYLQKMRKVLFNHDETEEAKKILKELWKNYRTGQKNEMAQTFLRAENFLNDYGLIEEYTAYRQSVSKSPVSYPDLLTLRRKQSEGYLQRMRKVLSKHDESEEAIKILKELWENYRTGQENEMAQTFVRAENFLNDYGLIAEYTACQQRVLKSPVTDPASMENGDDTSDLTKKQELLNQSGEQFAQPRRLRVELLNTLLGWIRWMARTLGGLKSLLTKFYKHHRNVFMACVFGSSPAVLFIIAVGAEEITIAVAVAGAAVAVAVVPWVSELR